MKKRKPQNYVLLIAVLLQKEKKSWSQTSLRPTYYQHKFKRKQVVKQPFFQVCPHLRQCKLSELRNNKVLVPDILGTKQPLCKVLRLKYK